MKRRSNRPIRRHTDTSKSLILIGPALVIMSLFPLYLSACGFRDIPMHANPEGLAYAAILVGLIGLGAFAYGACATFVGFAGERIRGY